MMETFEQILKDHPEAICALAIFALTGVATFLLIEPMKRTLRAKILQDSGTGRRPWWWSFGIRTASIFTGMVLSIPANLSMGSFILRLAWLDTLAIGFFGGALCTVIAGVGFAIADRFGVKVDRSDTLSLQTAKDEAALLKGDDAP